MRLIGFSAEAPAAIDLVIRVVTLEPHYLALALEGEDVRRHAVEKPAVVCDDDRTAGVVEQRLFKGAQGVDIEVVGRLVEQENVGPGLQHLRNMNAIALAA